MWNCLPERKWQQNFIENGFLGPKTLKKNEELWVKIIWKQDFWKSVFEDMHEAMGCENGPRKVAMQTMQQGNPKLGVLSWSLNHIIEHAISGSISLGLLIVLRRHDRKPLLKPAFFGNLSHFCIWPIITMLCVTGIWVTTRVLRTLRNIGKKGFTLRADKST